ncbi:TBC-domain-containing protein [Ascodesmis nigricans]|uniref:TBC-domain-containing protein n=1 Tax=Ascodesmis nigricans TaxID=341454 RepID=A0A4S2MPY6_9PEZI|nr:TBC-domain-containing protein [Ascodesmis nigricans]
MLVDAEVGNAVIERRLRECTKWRETERGERGYSEDVGEMLGEAMGEDVADGDAGEDTESMVSVEGSGVSEGPAKKPGWKGLFWGPKQPGRDDRDIDSLTSRRAASTGSAAIKKRGLPTPTSNPYQLSSAAMSRNGSRTSLSSVRSTNLRSVSLQYGTSSSRGMTPLPYEIPDVTAQGSSASSVGNWALRIAAISTAGGGQEGETGGEHAPPAKQRPRAISIPDSNGNDAKANRSRRTQNGNTNDRSSGSVPATTTKLLSEIRDTAEKIAPLGAGGGGGGGGEYPIPIEASDNGPMEMELILPPEEQPPPLLQLSVDEIARLYENEDVVDRLGFVYDKRRSGVSKKVLAERKKRDDEEGKVGEDGGDAPETPKEGEEERDDPKTPKRWPDITNESTSELASSASSISYMSAQSSTVPLDSNKDSTTAKTSILIDRISRPSISIPSTASTATAFSYNAPTTTITASAAKDITARILHLHDTQQTTRHQHASHQSERALKHWDDFLQTLRRLHCPSTNPSSERLLADGELISLATTRNTKNGKAKERWLEFRALVFAGIPDCYRHKIWPEFSGARQLRQPGYYHELLAQPPDDEDRECARQIEPDMDRTFTNNVWFKKGPGTEKLRRVLTAYARRNRKVGYCQGMNMIAASLLLVMLEEDAFWVLCAIVEKILPEGYFGKELEASRADQEVLQTLVSTYLPTLHTHLTTLHPEATLSFITIEWFLTLFTRLLPLTTTYRIWDPLLCISGSKFLFQTALALLQIHEKRLLECDSAAEVYAFLSGGKVAEVEVERLVARARAWEEVVGRAGVDGLRREVVGRRWREGGEREAVVKILVDEEEGEVEGVAGEGMGVGEEERTKEMPEGDMKTGDGRLDDDTTPNLEPTPFSASSVDNIESPIPPTSDSPASSPASRPLRTLPTAGAAVDQLVAA